MQFELMDTRIDATDFRTEQQAKDALAEVSRVPLEGGLVAVIVKPWEVFTNTSNPAGHGWGVRGNRVYAVARFVAMPEADQHDTGKVLVAYRRKLREAIKQAERFNPKAGQWAKEEIKRIEPRIFQLGQGFAN